MTTKKLLERKTKDEYTDEKKSDNKLHTVKKDVKIYAGLQYSQLSVSVAF